MRSMQFCNLSEVVIRESDTPESLEDKVEIASILGTFQSALTNFRYLRPMWRKNVEEERLLGVSLTGFKDEAVNRLIDMKAGTGREITIKPTYEVIVEVENEAQQKAAYDLLKEKGFKCRLVTF